MSHLDTLCDKLGIWHSFWDSGREYITDTYSKKELCRSLGYPADTEETAEASLAQYERDRFADFAPHVVVAREWEINALTVEVVTSLDMEHQTLSWFLTREDKTTDGGVQPIAELPILGMLEDNGQILYKRQLRLTLNAPLGYHALTFLVNDDKPTGNATTSLIVVPDACYMPPPLQNGSRAWGLPIQLYALKSHRNWGMGDFTDLKNMADVAEQMGAAIVGINPLNALFPDSPQDASPYFASSRIFLNPLYIDTDAVPEAASSPAYADYLASPRFQELLAASRASDTVTYDYIAEMKYGALNILYDAFKNLHLNAEGEAVTPRGEAFLAFCKEWEPDLTTFATCQALRSYFASQGKPRDWYLWEKEYQSPDTMRVAAFQETYADSILFIKYQQFIAMAQFDDVRAAYDRDGLAGGLYTDLPVGVGGASAEAWAHQELFLANVSAGAPPDFLNPKGQNWALAAFNPIMMKKTGYAFWIRILRQVMRPAGALRIDHAFSLMRLYLCVDKGTGAYLSYPFKDLLGIVALESVRNRTLVIGEDIGVVPPGFMEEMRSAGTLSFRLMQYQRWDNALMPAGAYEHRCLIVSGTHDMPTYPAFWEGLDIDIKKKLKVINKEQHDSEKDERVRERRRFVDAFIAEGLLPEPPEGRDSLTGDNMPDWFVPNTYAFLARTPSMLMLARPEDMVGQLDQVNVPGTYLNYPNWRFKLPVFIEDMTSDAGIQKVIDVIARERPKIVGGE